MKKSKMLTLALMMGMVLVVGCGNSNIGTENDEANESEQFQESELNESCETEVESELDNLDTEEDESVSSELDEGVSEDSSEDVESDTSTNEDETEDEEKDTSDTSYKPSNNQSSGSGSTNNTTSNTGSNSGTTSSGNSGSNSSGSNNSGSTSSKPSDNSSQGKRLAYALVDTAVYSDVDTRCAVYGTLLKGQGVEVMGKSSEARWSVYDDNGEWYKVKFGGMYGYILSKDMTETGNGKVAETTIVPQTAKGALDLINEERIKLGLQPAVWDEECERIALLRAQELFDLGHITSANAHAGFQKFKEEDVCLCECVAWGFVADVGAVTGWMNSDGHRNVLMSEPHVKLAIAYCGDKWVAINNIDWDLIE